MNIRNELAAKAYKDSLGSARGGSDTYQNGSTAARLAGGFLKGGAEAAIHGGLAATTGGVGNFMYQFGVKPAMTEHRLARAASARAALENRLLQVGGSQQP